MHHFRCQLDQKEYTIARHHFPKSLLVDTMNSGQRTTSPLTVSEALIHNIHEECDSFFDEGSNKRMFPRAPISPYSIARSTANSHTPGTSEFVRHERLSKRCATNEQSSRAIEEDDFFLHFVKEQVCVALPLAVQACRASLLPAALAVTVSVTSMTLFPCVGINHPILDGIKKALETNCEHQLSNKLFFPIIATNHVGGPMNATAQNWLPKICWKQRFGAQNA